MSDGMSDCYKRERIEKEIERKDKIHRIVKVIDELKWFIAEKVLEEIE